MNIRNEIRTIQKHVVSRANGDLALALKYITKMQEMLVGKGKARQMAILSITKSRIMGAV